MNQLARITLNTVAFAVLIFAGCNSKSETDSATTQLSTAPISSSAPKLSSEQLTTELARLDEKAVSLELENRLRDAADVRESIHGLLAANADAESWQVKNAKAIADAARRKSELDENSMALLDQSKQLFTRLQNQIKFNEVDSARTTAEEIISIQRQVFGANSMSLAQALVQIGTIEHHAAMTADAIPHFHQAVKIIKSLGLNEHPSLESAHMALGALYTRKKKFQPAIANQKEATRIAARLWGDSSIEFADQANQLGVMFHRGGNLEGALKILRASMAIRNKVLEADDPAIAHSLMNVGIAEKDLKMFADSKKSLERAKEIFAADGSPELYPYVLNCDSNIAALLMLEGNLVQAESLLAGLLKAAEAASPINPVYVAKCKYRYSIALARQGKYEMAQPLMEQAIQLQQQQLGMSHSETMATLEAYALLLKTTKQEASAEKMYEYIRQVSYETDDNNFQR